MYLKLQLKSLNRLKNRQCRIQDHGSSSVLDSCRALWHKEILRIAVNIIFNSENLLRWTHKLYIWVRYIIYIYIIYIQYHMSYVTSNIKKCQWIFSRQIQILLRLILTNPRLNAISTGLHHAYATLNYMP